MLIFFYIELFQCNKMKKTECGHGTLYRYEQLKLWEDSTAGPYFRTQMRERTRVFNIGFRLFIQKLVT